MNKPDVIVVGAGLAGLWSALTAARRGYTVQLITEGVGTLAMSSACLDLLGYVDGMAVDDPWQAMALLPAEHPYQLLGVDCVRTALEAFATFTAEVGWPCTAPATGKNRRVPTIMGTLKPTWLCPPSAHGEVLEAAQRVLILGVGGLKDCHPSVVQQQLQRYPSMREKTFSTAMVYIPESSGRTLSPLDVARYMDTQAGRAWVRQQLLRHSGAYDVALVPPICGTHASLTAWHSMCDALGCPVLEMLSLPPGVGGLRLRAALLHALRTLDVSIIENAHVASADMQGRQCAALIVAAPDGKRRHEAGQYILATGGLLHGGISVTPGNACESICHLPVPMPEDPDMWSQPDVFASHAITRMGVRVDAQLRPVDAKGQALLENVRFVGRTLGGYDFGLEKSGFGVAVASAWAAGQLV